MKNILNSIKLKLKFSEERYSFAAFALCVCIMLAGYIYMGIYPFGGNSILKIDMYHQYAPFHEELRHKILEGSSLLYSWSGLGKNFTAQFAYYTASPLNILLLFSRQEDIPKVMGYLVLIKVGLCGAFFSHYLKARFKKNEPQLLVFAVFYGLSAYITAFYWNIMWLDVIALFPLVALGIHRIIDKTGYKTYLFSLAACIIINFYLAFLVCLFSVIYFIVFLFCKYSIKNIKGYIKPAVVFSVCSLLAGGIAMILILPTYFALTNTAAYTATFPESAELYFNPLDYISAHFWGVIPRVMVRNESVPNIYCGILPLLLLPAYYIRKSAPQMHELDFNEYVTQLPKYREARQSELKEKILVSIFLVIFFIGFSINIADFAFHGFHFPACLPHRFSFIYIFLIVSMAYKAFADFKRENININAIVICAVAFAFFIFINEKIIVFAEDDIILGDGALIVNFVLLFAYAVLFILFKLGILNKKGFVIFLLIIVSSEFSMSSIANLPHKGYTPVDTYTGDMANTAEIISYLENLENLENPTGEDEKFYRMEFFRFKTTNDSALLHYRGMSHFSSVANGSTTKLLEQMGVSATENSCRYYDPTQLINAMFSIKYILYRDDVIYENVNDKTDLRFVKQTGGLSVYENLYWLPVGYMTDKNVLDWNAEQDNPFMVQNDFIEKSAGILEQPMFMPFIEREAVMRYGNITAQAHNGIYYYELQHAKNLMLVPEFKAVFENPADQYVYLYIDSPNSLMATIKIDANIFNRDFSAGRGTLDIGFVKAGTDISVSFKLDRRGDDEKQYHPSGIIKIFAAGYNGEAFRMAYERLNADTLDIYEFADGLLKGSITTEREGILLTSVPYDAGWRIYINGERTESIDFQNNSFIALNLTPGTYDIEMKYIPQGLILGAIITAVSVLIIVLYEIFSANKLRRKQRMGVQKSNDYSRYGLKAK